MAGHELVGVVTQADIQRPAVSMVTLSLILSAEEAMNDIIERSLGEQWLGRLSPGRQAKVRGVYDERKRANVEISLLQCLMLEDRLDLLGHCQAALEGLSFGSRTAFERWSSRLKILRNVLAHGDTILDAEQDPVKAIDLFMQTRRFAEATSQVAGRRAARRPTPARPR